MYTPDTLVAVQPFTRQQDGSDIIIGAAATGIFLAVPSGAVEVLDYLAEGRSVGEASEIYRQEHGEVPDLDSFLSVMESKGFIRRRDIAGLGADVPHPEGRPRHLSGISQSFARRLFSLPVLAFCAVLIICAAAALINNPSLCPGPGDLVFSGHRSIAWAVVLVATWAGVIIHELGHLIAARAIGIDSRIGAGNRLWVLVAETDLTGLWAVPRGQRYLPLLAGPLVDAVSAAALILLLYIADRGWLVIPGTAISYTRALIFTYFMRLAWQCFLFVRTDFYYVLASLFGCRNLLGDTEALIRNQMARFLPWVRPVDQSGIPAAELRVIRAYAFLWLAGRIIALIVLFTVVLPLAGRYLRDISGALISGYDNNPYNFWDALLLTSLFMVPLATGMTLWIREMMHRERNPT